MADADRFLDLHSVRHWPVTVGQEADVCSAWPEQAAHSG